MLRNASTSGTATPTPTAPHTSTVPFDASTPLSPAEGYTGPSIHGGYTFSSSTYPFGFADLGQGFINDYIALSDGNDAIYFNVTGPNTAAFHEMSMSFASVFVFNQDSFETPYRTGNVGIDSFSIRLGKNATGGTSARFNPEGRWLVKIGDTYYLSNTTFTLLTNLEAASFTLGGEELQQARWAAYDPGSSLFFDAGGASFSELALEQVTAVGFYVEDTSFQSNVGTIGMRLAVSEFTVTAIPEPGSLALLGFGLPCLLGYLFHRSRKAPTQP